MVIKRLIYIHIGVLLIVASCIEKTEKNGVRNLSKKNYFFFIDGVYNEVEFRKNHSVYLFSNQQKTYIGKLDSINNVVRDSSKILEILTEKIWINSLGDTLTVFPLDTLLHVRRRNFSGNKNSHDFLYRNSLALCWLNECHWLICSSQGLDSLKIDVDTSE